MARDNDEAKVDRAPVHERLPKHLTERERKQELRAQEAIIERFRRAGLEAGRALDVIRSQRLYRGMKLETQSGQILTIVTFPQYCQLRWGFDASRARQLIAGARGAEILEEETGIAPVNENQVRPLIRMLGSEESRPLALAPWRAAAERNHGMTEKSVRQAIEEVEQPSPEMPIQPPVPVGEVISLIGDLRRRLAVLLDLIDRSHYESGLTDDWRGQLRSGLEQMQIAIRDALKVL